MTHIINYIFIIYLVIWPAIFNLILPIDGAGRIYVIYAILIFILNISNKKFRKILYDTPVKIWAIWVFYVSISWYIKDSYNPTEANDFLFICNYIILPFIALWITTYEATRNTKSISMVAFFSFLIFSLLGLLLQNNGENLTRGGELLGNSLPLNALCLFFISSFCCTNRWIKEKTLWFILFIAICAILMVSTRKAFVGIIIIVFFYLYGKYRLNKPQNIFILLFCILLGYLIFDYILNNTMLGERLHTIQDEGENFNESNIQILNILGDRAFFYINGWDLFITSPITGIGLRNFQPIAGAPFPIHSELIVQLCETGLIGSLLYLAFNLKIVNNILLSQKDSTNKLSNLVNIAWMLAYFIISMTTWTYQFPRYFIVLGLIIGFTYNNLKHENTSSY